MTPSKTPQGEQKSSQNKKNDQNKKKSRKNRQESYQTYIYKVLKQIHPDLGISKKAIDILNSLVNDIFERIATESIQLLKLSNKRTLKSREIHNAIKLIFQGNLLKYGMSEGVKAVQIYLHGQTSMPHF